MPAELDPTVKSRRCPRAGMCCSGPGAGQWPQAFVTLAENTGPLTADPRFQLVVDTLPSQTLNDAFRPDTEETRNGAEEHHGTHTMSMESHIEQLFLGCG